MNGCRHEILFSSFFLKTPDFSLCLCFNIMEPDNPVFRQKIPQQILDLKNICGKILVLPHLFKGDQVFKFKTEHKINVYFLIFIALPIVHCTRQKSLLGRHRPSKWLQMAKNAILWPLAGLVDPNWWNKVGTSQSTPRQCHGTISLVKNAHWGAQLPQKCPKKSSMGP